MIHGGKRPGSAAAARPTYLAHLFGGADQHFVDRDVLRGSCLVTTAGPTSWRPAPALPLAGG